MWPWSPPTSMVVAVDGAGPLPGRLASGRDVPLRNAPWTIFFLSAGLLLLHLSFLSWRDGGHVRGGPEVAFLLREAWRRA